MKFLGAPLGRRIKCLYFTTEELDDRGLSGTSWTIVPADSCCRFQLMR